MRVTTFCDTCSNIACNIAKKIGCFGSRNYDYGLQPTCTGSIFVIKLIFTWSHFDISFPFIRGLFQSYLHILNGCSSLPMCIGIHSEVSWGSEVSLICLDWYMFQSYVIKFRILYQIEFGYGFWNRFSK